MSDFDCGYGQCLEEREQLKKDIEDFEKAGLAWQAGYNNLLHEHDISMKHKQQIIESLQKEVEEWKRIAEGLGHGRH